MYETSVNVHAQIFLPPPPVATAAVAGHFWLIPPMTGMSGELTLLKEMPIVAGGTFVRKGWASRRCRNTAGSWKRY